MTSHTLLGAFGILGNISSIISYLAPLATFAKIRKRKSTLGFQSLPYVTSLLNAVFWLYYAILIRRQPFPLIVVNSIGCFIEAIYIVFYLAYAPRAATNATVKLLSLFVGLSALIFLFTMFVVKSLPMRLVIVGWCCVVITIAGFASPLTISFQVVRTRSLEYMPIALSLSLMLNAVVYGLVRHDLFIEIPNICGVILGVLQMVLYGTCRYANVNAKKKKKNSDTEGQIDIVLGTPEVHPVGAETSDTEKRRSVIKTFENGQTNNDEKRREGHVSEP